MRFPHILLLRWLDADDRYGGECWAGEALAPSSMLRSNTSCSMPCKGNDTEFCGAGDFLQTYQLTSNITKIIYYEEAKPTTTTAATPYVNSRDFAGLQTHELISVVRLPLPHPALQRRLEPGTLWDATTISQITFECSPIESTARSQMPRLQ